MGLSVGLDTVVMVRTPSLPGVEQTVRHPLADHCTAEQSHLLSPCHRVQEPNRKSLKCPTVVDRYAFIFVVTLLTSKYNPHTPAVFDVILIKALMLR